jgi:hypothetical protein
VISRVLANRRLDALRTEVEMEAGAVALPDDLEQQVEALLRSEPTLPWDIAVARIARRTIGDDK